MQLLVAEMVRGNRELIAGLVQDPQLGPCVMLGLGGILAEALGDVVFAAAPLSASEARRMLRGSRASRLLLEPVPRRAAGRPSTRWRRCSWVSGASPSSGPTCASVDVNPLIVRDGRPDRCRCAGGAREPPPAGARRPRARRRTRSARASRRSSIRAASIVAGASSHPGKFGFVAFHNLLRYGYRGALFPVNRDGAEVLGAADAARRRRRARTAPPISSSSARRTPRTRRCCARAPRKGVRAAFVASGGYGEAGDEGRALERELVAAADELGMLLAGPNGQGVDLDAGVDVRADRGALPAAGPHLGREPERQPALVAS